MPIPVPKKDESRDDFIKRFMSDPTMLKDFPDERQRAALAYRKWRDKVNSEVSMTASDRFMAAVKALLPLAGDDISSHETSGGLPLVDGEEPMNIAGSTDLQAAISSDQPNKFSMVLYSGAPMRPTGYREDVVLDLSTLELPMTGQINVLADHQNTTDSIVGSGQVVLAAGKLTVHGVTSQSTSAGKRVTGLLREKQPLQASVGCDRIQVRRLASDTVINGRNVKAGTLVTVRARLREATVTPCGGDGNTSVLAASAATSKSGPSSKGQSQSSKEFSMKWEEFLASLNLKAEDLTDEQKTGLQASWKAKVEADDAAAQKKAADELAASKAAGDDLAASMGNQQAATQTPDEIQAAMIDGFRQQTADERERQGKLDVLVANFSTKVDGEESSKLLATAIKDNWHPDQLELELMRAARPDPSQFAIHSSDDGIASAEVIEASLLMSTGQMSTDQVAQSFDTSRRERIMNSAMDGRVRGYGIRRLCHETIQAAGMHVPVGQYDDNFVRASLVADSKVNPYDAMYAATSMGGISTVSVSGILSNVMHKLLLQSFMGDSNGMSCLQRISSVRSVSDFKEHNIYRLTADGTYQQMAPGGNLKYMSLQEEENSIRAHTYGVMLSLNREMIINDDLNAFAKVPALIGRQARMNFLRIGYTVFLDDDAFYTVARGNLIENNPFDIDGLTTAVLAFSKLRDLNNDPIDTVPRFTVVPSPLEVLADQIYTDTNIIAADRDTAATATTFVTNGNPHKGKYAPNATSWLDETGALVAGGSDTSWYISSGETDMLPLQVAYLNGNQTPRIERVELPADKLGMGWRSYFDFGFARQEWRGSIKCLAGAAVAAEATKAQTGRKPAAKK